METSKNHGDARPGGKGTLYLDCDGELWEVGSRGGNCQQDAVFICKRSGREK